MDRRHENFVTLLHEMERECGSSAADGHPLECIVHIVFRRTLGERSNNYQVTFIRLGPPPPPPSLPLGIQEFDTHIKNRRFTWLLNPNETHGIRISRLSSSHQSLPPLFIYFRSKHWTRHLVPHRSNPRSLNRDSLCNTEADAEVSHTPTLT